VRTADPVVLLVAAKWWPAPARLAAALIEQGCAVYAVCPPHHALRYVEGVKVYALRAASPRRSLAQALRRAQPDFVLPCDDRCVLLLHELHRRQAEFRELIERSLGDAGAFAVLESRARLLSTARELGIRVIDAREVESAAEASAGFALTGPTPFLKMDGTGGGEGVQMVRSAAEAARAYRSLRTSLGLATSLKRAVINRDPLALWSWGRRASARVILQPFVAGTPANIMAACWQGEVLGTVMVEVLASQGATGAAVVVRLIENAEARAAATRLAAHLRLSGFFGLDFILEPGSRAAHLIEMNPRSTQLGHLKLPQGDLAGAWCAAALRRERQRVGTAIDSDTIALFPQAWRWGAKRAFLERVHHDVPWEQRRLVEALVREPWPERQWRARVYHLLRRPAHPQALEMEAAAGEQVGQAQ
jgi:hypothetical protein